MWFTSLDPQSLSTDQWADIGLALKFLWLALLSAIIGAGSLITAHALIPSMVSTHTIDVRFLKYRRPFYLVGTIGVLGIGIFLFLAAQQTDWIRDMYPRFWQ